MEKTICTNEKGSMNLEGRTLLLMGGSAYAKNIKDFKAKGRFRIVSIGRDENTPISAISDVFYHIDTKDVEAVAEVVRKENVDGIFVGASEVNIPSAIKVSEMTGARFYASAKQWDIISNKATFKKLCREYGVPVVTEYSIDPCLPIEDQLNSISFPVIIKPVDSSGARGISTCKDKEDFINLYNEALRWSPSKQIIVEKLIESANEVFFHYTIQDGEASLTAAFTKVRYFKDDSCCTLPVYHMYPCRYIDEFCSKVDANAKRMFQALDINNGMIMLQGFYADGEFSFYESGFRMGGEQLYIFTDYLCGVNSLEYMIQYALTGRMSDYRISERDNAKFTYPCCNYYVGLKPGVISEMRGINEVEHIDGVLNVTVMASPGDVVPDSNALERICLRIHVVGKTPEELAETLEKTSHTLEIISDKGEEMQIERLSYERCILDIRDSIMIESV